MCSALRAFCVSEPSIRSSLPAWSFARVHSLRRRRSTENHPTNKRNSPPAREPRIIFTYSRSPVPARRSRPALPAPCLRALPARLALLRPSPSACLSSPPLRVPPASFSRPTHADKRKETAPRRAVGSSGSPRHARSFPTSRPSRRHRTERQIRCTTLKETFC